MFIFIYLVKPNTTAEKHQNKKKDLQSEFSRTYRQCLYLYKNQNDNLNNYQTKLDLTKASLHQSTDTPKEFQIHQHSYNDDEKIYFKVYLKGEDDAKQWTNHINDIQKVYIDIEDEKNNQQQKQKHKQQQNNDIKNARGIDIKDKLKAVNGELYDAEFVFIATFKHLQKLAHEFINDK